MQVTCGFSSLAIPSSASPATRGVPTRYLRLPNTFSSQNIAEATPPGFVAADATNLIIAANETHGANPSESGIAVYALDPRCDA